MHGDIPSTAKSTKEITLSSESPEVGNANQYFFAHDFFQVFNFFLVKYAGADRSATPEHPDVVILEGWFFPATHVGFQAFDQSADNLLFFHIPGGAGWCLQKGIHGIAFDRGKVVQLRKQRPGEKKGNGHQCDNNRCAA